MRHPRTIVLLTCALVPQLAACGDDGATDTREVTVELDASDTTNEIEIEFDEGDADGDSDDSDSDGDSASDAETDVPVDVPVGVACSEGEACTDLLDDEGRCPATCIAFAETATCRGVVVDGTCRPELPPEGSPAEVDFGDFRVRTIDLPSDALVGDVVAFELEIVNQVDHALDLPLLWRHPDTWQIADPSWDGLTGIHVEAGATVTLTATLTAMQPTVLTNGPGLIASFDFGDQHLYQPAITVHFAASEPITCGDEHFPASYCPDPESCYSSYAYYNSGVCCAEVFYPGANCCSSDDCAEGVCADGHCVLEAPTFATANTLPVGNQKVLLVIVDAYPELAGDPCRDHADTLADDLQLDQVGAFYDDVALRRAGRTTMALRWTVRAGIAASDFIGSATNDWASFAGALDAYFIAHGCAMRGTFDKLIVSAPTLDLQRYGGIYFGAGEIGVHDHTRPFLLAHELGHSFGANDRYLDLGGQLQHAQDLMGNDLDGPGFPGDGTMWTEIGFGDIDHSGVIDIAEVATSPSQLVLVAPQAHITTRRTLELAWQLGAVDGDGRTRRIVTDRMRVRVPVVAFDTDVFGAQRDKTLVFDDSQLDLAALAAAGHVELGVTVSLRVTDAAWQTRTFELAATIDLPLVVD